MGRHPTGNRKYEIQHMWEIHREVVRRLVLGQKPADIARDLKISKQTVSNIQNSTIARREIERLRRERDEETRSVHEHIKEIAPKAVEVLEELMTPSAPMSVRLRAAQDVLDRAGYSPIRKSIDFRATLTPEDVERIKQRGRQIKAMILGEEVGDETNSIDNAADAHVIG